MPDDFMYLFVLVAIGIIVCKLLCWEISIRYNIKKLPATIYQKKLYNLLLRRKHPLQVPTEMNLYRTLSNTMPHFYERQLQLLSREQSDQLLLALFYYQWLTETIQILTGVAEYNRPVPDIILQ